MDNQSKIQHLYWRAGFGAGLADIDKNKDKPIQKIAEQFFKDAQNIQSIKVVEGEALTFKEMLNASKESPEKIRELRKESRQHIKQLNLKWIEAMGNTLAPLREKMTFFWHGHFACQHINVYFIQNQINTLRKYALGNFGDLVLAISKDPAMLAFLNNQQNRKMHPNENFARELMELFTLGRGNYTEDDIKESARAFTGWGFDGGEFVFREKFHDFGSKTFMGKTGNFSGEEIIKMILEKPECAKFITKKIYKFFVNEIPDETRIEQLAKSFYQSNYNIEALMRQIFSADWFYDEKNVGAKIKSPVELLVGLQRQFNLKFITDEAPLFIQKILGQVLLYPPNVAGWEGGKSWIDSSTLMFRLRLPEVLFKAAEISVAAKDEEDVQKADLVNARLRNFQAQFDWTAFQKNFVSFKNPEILYENLSNYLLQKKSPQLKIYFQKAIQEIKTSNQEEVMKNMSIALASMPEYQLY